MVQGKGGEICLGEGVVCWGISPGGRSPQVGWGFARAHGVKVLGMEFSELNQVIIWNRLKP